MNRGASLAYRHNARVLSLSLPEHVRQHVFTDQFVGRASSPPTHLTPAERTRFSAIRSALDASRGLGRRIGDSSTARRESHEFEVLMDRGGVGNPASAAVRLLLLLVPCADDPGERAHLISEIEPVIAWEVELWPLVKRAATALAGIDCHITKLQTRSAMLHASRSYGAVIDDLLSKSHPLAVLAAVQTMPGKASLRRLSVTTELFHQVFTHYETDIDVWTADSNVWVGMYIDTSALIHLEIDAHRSFQAAATVSPEAARSTWAHLVRPLTWVNAALRRLERAGADVGDILLLPTEPRAGKPHRPDSHLFSSDHLRRLMLLGCEVLLDPLELWAWRNLWVRGCRPQACLPLPSELLPFEGDSWRVLVPKNFSKTGMIVDYVLTPVARLVGWSPDACPIFTRATNSANGIVPTRIAEDACRRVRKAWVSEQRANPLLPEIPDRLAYMSRKLLALWMAQRVSTPVLTRWLSHTTSSTNTPYAQPTVSQLLEIRNRQREHRT